MHGKPISSENLILRIPALPKLALACLLAHAAIPFTPALADGQSGNNRYLIAAQPLYSALSSLAEQNGIQFTYSADIVQGLNSPGATGSFTVEQALQKILAGSGLSYRFNGAHTVVLEPSAKAPRQPAAEQSGDSSTLKLPTITVKSTALSEGVDPRNEDYSVTNTTTATKTDTPIIRTPVNIQVIPQQILKDQQVVRLEQALQNVSGVGVVQNGGDGDAFSVRGFAVNNYYRNGVLRVTGNSPIGPREVSNVERIEVLKGPASILYGRIEPGGLINVVTKQPWSTPYTAISQQFGSFDYYRTSIDTTGPVTGDGKLLYRLGFAYEDAGSFVDFVNSDHVLFAPTLQWNISDRTQATFNFEYYSADDVQGGNTSVVAGPRNPDNPLVNRPLALPRNRFLGEPGDGFSSHYVDLGYTISHQFNDNWRIKHNFNANLNTLERQQTTFPLNLDFGAFYPEPLANCDPANGSCQIPRGLTTGSGFQDAYYTSLDLTGHVDTFNLKHTLLFGTDYYHLTFGSIGSSPLVSAIDAFNPVYGQRKIVFDDAQRNIQTTTSWNGVYFQDQVQFPHDVFFLAGFRYDNARVDRDRSNNPNQSLGEIEAAGQVKPRFGLLWQPVSELSLYSNYVENFGVGQTNNDGTTLPPQTAQQWEVGAKTELFDGRLSASLAWFNLTRQNVATTSLADPNVLVAIGEARNQGLEFDFSGEILPGWKWIGSYAYIDSEITRDNDGNQGNRLFNVPEHSGSLWNTYEFLDGFLRGFKFGGGIVAKSQRQSGIENDTQLPGYAILNLVAAYQWKVGKYAVKTQLNIDNLLDKYYFAGSQNRDFNLVGTPRTFLGSVSVNF